MNPSTHVIAIASQLVTIYNENAKNKTREHRFIVTKRMQIKWKKKLNATHWSTAAHTVPIMNAEKSEWFVRFRYIYLFISTHLSEQSKQNKTLFELLQSEIAAGIHEKNLQKSIRTTICLSNALIRCSKFSHSVVAIIH